VALAVDLDSAAISATSSFETRGWPVVASVSTVKTTAIIRRLR
jgi:hypothetical protein